MAIDIVTIILLVLLWLKEDGATSIQYNRDRTMELPPQLVEDGYPSGDLCNTENSLYLHERNNIIDTINRLRAMVHNNVLSPKPANVRNMTYSCTYEAEAKFECTFDPNPDFKSDEYTWRRANGMSVFDESILNNEMDTLRLILPPEALEIGCFQQRCNRNYFIACKTGHVINPSVNTPFNISLKRCKVDSDCTLPGYTKCDTSFGLCDLDPADKATVPPFICMIQSDWKLELVKEDCNGVYDTGSDHSQAERNKIVQFVNEYRASINNNCTLGLGVVKPASNYRKVKYSCALENEARFQCNTDFTTFKSDKYTWRRQKPKSSLYERSAFFWGHAPFITTLLIDPHTQAVNNSDDAAVFIKLFMSEDVTEIGCFVKVCDDMEYIACRTNHDRSLPNNAPLYTPGRRCNSDADCTLPGYHICDANLGLCDYKSHNEKRVEAKSLRCEQVRNIWFKRVAEKCNPGEYDTGSDFSNKEREAIVYFVNQYRKLINNNCDLGNGDVDSIWNYRKVRYSCALEADAKFECTNLDHANFKSDMFTLRVIGKVEVKNHGWSLFKSYSPRNHTKVLNNMYWENTSENANYLRLMLRPDVTEIGCFFKICGEYEYLACKTGHIVKELEYKPLFTTGSRPCQVDSDCTLPGYSRCDTDINLCDIDPNAKYDITAVSPLVCLNQYNTPMDLFKESCDGLDDTGSGISQAERNKIVDFVNEIRAFVNNDCQLGFGTVKPASNYRKVRYSCSLEKEAKFECSSDLTLDSFISDEYTWREVETYNENPRVSIFERSSPGIHRLLIDANTRVALNLNNGALFVRLFMSEDVTEVGCYVKACGDKEYIACRTNHDRNLPSDAPLYTPGERCNSDADCTLPGYSTCDIGLGLCDYKSHRELKKEASSSKCASVRHYHIDAWTQKCGLEYDTGSTMSNKERESIVYVVNQFRKLINSNCNLGKGVVKQITNYRKVKYSCLLEEEATFDCQNVNHTNFKSDKFTWRSVEPYGGTYRKATFIAKSPWNQHIMMDPENQTINDAEKAAYFRLVLSPDATKIGCFNKICGDYEYIACKTGHVVVASKNEPLYKPGYRCLADEDCTLLGYGICDTDSGMCEAEFGNLSYFV